MTDEVSENENQGKIVITVSEDKIGYDSNLPLPDTVFWMETVKKLIVAKVMPESD